MDSAATGRCGVIVSKTGASPEALARANNWRCGFLALLVTGLCFLPCPAAEPDDADVAIRVIKQRNFVVHTDLADDATGRFIARMNATLHRAEKYWGKRLPGRIECYLVKDLRRWTCGDLPDHGAHAVLREIGGATEVVPSSRDESSRRRARIYATTKVGVAEHEVIHAYCVQTFGTTGPCWYREGMAQFGSYDRTSEEQSFPEHVAEFLRNQTSLSVEQIVERNEFTSGLFESIPDAEESSGNDWITEDRLSQSTTTESPSKQRQTIMHHYWESWALCCFLEQHPHYRERFRLLGECYMRKQQGIFGEFFGSVATELSRDFRDFVAEL